MTIKDTIGFKAEEWAVNILSVTRDTIHVSKANPASKHDILWGNEKVEVKSSNFNYGEKKRKHPRWKFMAKKGLEDADFFFCIGLLNNVPIRHYLIPRALYGRHGVKICPFNKSKWDNYEYLNFVIAE